jgi:Helix-turn-helix domain
MLRSAMKQGLRAPLFGSAADPVCTPDQDDPLAGFAARARLSDDPLLSREEACEYLGGLSYSTIWAAVKIGEMEPGLYIGRRLFFRRSGLDAFLASRPRQGTNETPTGRPFPNAAAAVQASMAAHSARRAAGYTGRALANPPGTAVVPKRRGRPRKNGAGMAPRGTAG